MADINYYLLRRTVAQTRADAAENPKVRASHQHMADAYRQLLHHEQARRGARFPLVQ
jgi:hypothetical protein